MNDVNEARARIKELAEVNQTFAQANTLYVQSATANNPEQSQQTYQQAVELTNQADSLAQSYYEKYPNCLSRAISPWVG